jgi:hypothetical protein
MPALPGNEAAYERALTMRAYHRDAEVTARVVIIVFGLVFGFEGTMWLVQDQHPALAFGALFGLAALLFGMWLHTRHGRKVAEWQAVLNTIEARRRDTTIHAIHIHINPADRITSGQITSKLNKFPGRIDL